MAAAVNRRRWQPLLLALFGLGFFLQTAGQGLPLRQPEGRELSGQRLKILLIPMDGRPPCLQFPQKIGEIAGAEVVTPPADMLGRFLEPGRPEEIIRWLESQDLGSFDAVLVSLDMLAYGGLVASRDPATAKEAALRRLHFLKQLKVRAPGVPVYLQSVIMRIALTWDGENEHYYHDLSRWAELSGGLASPEEARALEALEAKIPKGVIPAYMQARERNLAINLAAINLVAEGAADYLILSQDDAKPRGVHVADRELLLDTARKLGLEERVAVQPGADEVMMLLLARALNSLNEYRPRVHAVYSSRQIRREVMPYEDRPLEETVSRQIAAAGAVETAGARDADILFYVYASRFEPGKARSFARAVARQLRKGRRVMIADVDAGGMVQGGDTLFLNELLDRGICKRLSAYASWNTAGNTIGTALGHGLVFELSRKQALPEGKALQAQHWFMLHRIIDDTWYHSVLRPRVKDFLEARGLDRYKLDAVHSQEVSAMALRELKAEAPRLIGRYWGEDAPRVEALHFSLPWGRTFEAEIDFRLDWK